MGMRELLALGASLAIPALLAGLAAALAIAALPVVLAAAAGLVAWRATRNLAAAMRRRLAVLPRRRGVQRPAELVPAASSAPGRTVGGLTGTRLADRPGRV